LRRSCELIWDPEKARSKGIPLEKGELDIGGIPHNKKESALLLLHERDYDLAAFNEAVRDLKPSDGTDWSPEKKDRFHSEIFRLRKDLPALCKSMDIDMKTCLAYYLGTYKKSDDYRLLKTVCAEDYAERMDGPDWGLDACAFCGDGGSLLICDGCEGEYHMGCMRPPLESIPEGHWECDECVDEKFLAAREFVIRHSSIFEEQSKKRKFDDLESEESGESSRIVLRPSLSVLEAVRHMASSVSSALSNGISE
jgi:hypothetical protein